jgi:putative transposase
VLLKTSGMAKSTYHYYCRKAKIPDKYQEEKKLIHEIFKDNRGRYGYRRITHEMRKRGYLINHKIFLDSDPV